MVTDSRAKSFYHMPTPPSDSPSHLPCAGIPTNPWLSLSLQEMCRNATSSFPARQKMSPRLSQRGIWATCGSDKNAGPQLTHSIRMRGRACGQGQGHGGNLPGDPLRVEYQTHNPAPSSPSRIAAREGELVWRFPRDK